MGVAVDAMGRDYAPHAVVQGPCKPPMSAG